MSDKIRGSGSNKISIIRGSDKDNKQIMLTLYQLRMLQHNQKKRKKKKNKEVQHKLVDGIILTCPRPDGLIDRPDNRKNSHKCELKLI